MDSLPEQRIDFTCTFFSSDLCISFASLIMNILKFVQFNSAVDASFWQSLVSKKLNILKLSDEPQSIRGYYTLGQSAIDEQGNTVHISSPFSIPAEGLDVNASM